MSHMNLSVIETNVHKLSIDIRDLENEVQTTRDFIQELTNSLARQNIRLHQLETRIHEKKNMIDTLCHVRDHRTAKLQCENEWRSKIRYVNDCQRYLMEHSQHKYNPQDMTFQEIIEYAHKLHLIRCMSEWIRDRQGDVHQIDFPLTEMDFEIFEARNIVGDDNIRILQEDTMVGYIIPLKVWYDLFEMQNEDGFTVRSDVSVIDRLIKQMTFI